MNELVIRNQILKHEADQILNHLHLLSMLSQ